MTEHFSLVTHAKRCVRECVDILDGPDADVAPVLLVYGKRGLQIVGLSMPDEEAKDRMAQVIVTQLAFAEATECALISTVYMAPASSSLDMNLKASQSPDRTEQVMLVHRCPDGQTLYAAELTRHLDKRPDLGEWTELGGAMGGRFGDAIELGMAMARTVPEIPGLADIVARGWANDAAELKTMMQLFVEVLNRKVQQ